MNTLFQTITNRGEQTNDDDKIVQMSSPSIVQKTSKIIVKDLELMMFIGVLDSEKEEKQKVIVNLVLNVVQNENWKCDSIDSVVSYADIIERIGLMAEGPHIHLVETFAEQIGEMCFSFPDILGATIRIEKPDIIANTASVGVEISISR